MSKTPDVSIILPACNEGDWLRKTVANFHEDLPEAEIVAVDDGSTDGCADGLPDFVRLIHNETRKGVGGARNTGMDAASGETFIVADSHVEVIEPGSLQAIVDLAVSQGAFAVPQYRSIPELDKDGNRLPMKGPRWGGHFLFMRDQYLGWQYEPKHEEQEYPIEVPNGGCYAFTRALRDKLGLWPTTAGLWGHNPVTKGLLCWFTDTPVILTRNAQIAHAYKAPNYELKLEYQWQNACRTYSIVFAEATYHQYWKPILARVLGETYVEAMWESTEAERERFATIKAHTDAEFFKTCLHAPVVTALNSVTAVPRVSVIIPCHNEPMIKATVDSIRESNKFDHDIVVVDDASTDGCCDKLKRQNKTPDAENIQLWMHEQHELAARKKALAGNRKGCMVLRHEERQGVSGARNAGCKAVDKFADILLFSDGHVLWDKDTVRQLAQTVIDTGGIVASSFANWRESPADATRRVYGANLVLRTKRGLGAEYRRTEPDSDVSPVPHIIGSVYGMWQTTLDRIGGWVHVDGGQWGCAEAFVTLAAYFNGIPMHVDKRCFVKHHTPKGGKASDLQGYIRRVHLLHSLPFTGDLYVNLFRPVIDELGPLVVGEALTEACRQYYDVFWANRVKSEADFMRDYFPAMVAKYDADVEKQKVKETAASLAASGVNAYGDLASKPDGTAVAEIFANKGGRVPELKPSQVQFAHRNEWLEALCCNRPNALILIDSAGKAHLMFEAQEGDQTRVTSYAGATCCPFCGMAVSDMAVRPPVIGLGVLTHMQTLEQNRAKQD